VDITDAMLRACEQRSIRLAVSLDGGPVGHNRVRRFPNGQGTYKKVLETIECALAYTIPVSLSITLTSQNLVDVEAAVKYAMERDIPFKLNFVRILDAAPKNPLVPDINALIDVVERCFQVAKSCLDHYSSPLTGILDRVHFDLPHAYACAAGRHYLAIDTQGHISPCQMLLSNPWGRLDQQVSLQNLRARSTEVFGPTVNKASDCRTCFWKYACGGGCPLLRNSVLHNQYCEVYRNLLPTLVRLEGLRLLKSASHIYGRGH
jgi:uncharacterized protein